MESNEIPSMPSVLIEIPLLKANAREYPAKLRTDWGRLWGFHHADGLELNRHIGDRGLDG